MGSGSLATMKEFFAKETGLTTFSMVWVKNIGLMVPFLEDISKEELRKKVDFLGQTKATMKVSSLTISLKEKGYFIGKMVDSMTAIGKTI